GPHRVHQRALVEQVALVQDDAVADVLDAIELLCGGAAHHPVHVVAVLQEELGEVGPVLAGDSGDERGAFVVHGPDPIGQGRQMAFAGVSSRSHRTVEAMPCSTPILASQPSSSLAFSTEGQRRGTSTSHVGRCSSSKSAGSSPHASQMTRAVSLTVSSREAEMLKSSFSPAGEDIAVTTPSAMSSMWVSVRVCSPEPKICRGRCPERTFLIRSGTICAIPGSASGISPGP